ncbi:anti-anti-sigma factor [Rubrobacter radiotolerans]|uniref:Anti-sigma factor antagonist n=1 Tax=Rubrobacter radiotolerans TaxID=42256 RepID=A0A023X4C5_RUBRA|nr:STAS domain-containing protein [Rubrobacter radiotolerans]AHY46909.1 anti-anti-sigma factor [Rubrobacter radiotolerans]MDX5894314.1 STAS domain-containing protein [Rubrobacter radiotolerans]SMC05710.1 anti-sigma B factor antagonist [Rubrobacter radiotolerans DSM 5868]
MGEKGVPFVVLVHHTDGVPVVKVSGELDILSAEKFRGALERIVSEAGEVGRDRTPVVVVDLSGVDFMDSCGLSALAGATRGFRQSGGEIRLVTKGSPVVRTLGVTGLLCVFDLFPDVSTAVRRGVA